MQSVTNVTWWYNGTEAKLNYVRISYDSSTNNLLVVFTGVWSNRTQTESLYSLLDLSNYLPEWVTFGFSAAKSFCSEKMKLNLELSSQVIKISKHQASKTLKPALTEERN